MWGDRCFPCLRIHDLYVSKSKSSQAAVQRVLTQEDCKSGAGHLMACRPDLTALEEVSLGGSVAELMAINFWLSERGGRLLQSLVACTPQRPLVMESGCRQCSQQSGKWNLTIGIPLTTAWHYKQYSILILWHLSILVCVPPPSPSAIFFCPRSVHFLRFMTLSPSSHFIFLRDWIWLVSHWLRDHVSTCLFAVNQSTNQPACGSKGESV